MTRLSALQLDSVFRASRCLRLTRKERGSPIQWYQSVFDGRRPPPKVPGEGEAEPPKIRLFFRNLLILSKQFLFFEEGQ